MQKVEYRVSEKTNLLRDSAPVWCHMEHFLFSFIHFFLFRFKNCGKLHQKLLAWLNVFDIYNVKVILLNITFFRLVLYLSTLKLKFLIFMARENLFTWFQSLYVLWQLFTTKPRCVGRSQLAFKWHEFALNTSRWGAVFKCFLEETFRSIIFWGDYGNIL